MLFINSSILFFHNSYTTIYSSMKLYFLQLLFSITAPFHNNGWPSPYIAFRSVLLLPPNVPKTNLELWFFLYIKWTINRRWPFNTRWFIFFRIFINYILCQFIFFRCNFFFNWFIFFYNTIWTVFINNIF